MRSGGVVAGGAVSAAASRHGNGRWDEKEQRIQQEVKNQAAGQWRDRWWQSKKRNNESLCFLFGQKTLTKNKITKIKKRLFYYSAALHQRHFAASLTREARCTAKSCATSLLDHLSVLYSNGGDAGTAKSCATPFIGRSVLQSNGD